MKTSAAAASSSKSSSSSSKGSSSSSKSVVLISDEGERFSVSREVASQSGLLKLLVFREGEAAEDDAEEDEIGEVPLPNVSSEILEFVIEFCEHYVEVEGTEQQLGEIEKPLKSADLYDLVPEWYAQFVDLPLSSLFQLVSASNYMDVKPLLTLSCAKVAALIKDKDAEAIRKTFGIKNDFTPEEEEVKHRGGR